MPVQNPFGLSFSGNITQWDNTPLSPPSAFGTCPGLGCCSTVTAAIPVNASLFVGTCTSLTATLAGSPPVEALNVNVVNPLTVTFTESSLPVTQGTSPWVVSGTVAISNASICVTQCTSPWVVSGTVAFSNTTIAVTNTGTFAVQATIPTPTDWGTAPATSVLVPAVNAEMFVGQNAVSGTNPVPVSATTAANNAGNPIYVDVTNTVPVTLASTTITGTVAVTQSTSPWVVSGTVTVSGTSTVQGNLTNNNAAPNAFNLGVLPAIAETAYTTITYTTGDQVLPVTDLHGALNVDWQALAGAALGGPTIWATAPTGEEVQGVNAYCFQGTSPWVVSLASTTITGTVAVTQSGTWTVQQGGAPWTFVGALTNNNAAPAATNIGVLPALAETAYNTITYTTGDQVLPVTDLHGALNQDLQAVAGVALGATAVVPYGSTPAGVNVPAVNAFITNTVPVTLASTTITGTVAVTQSTSPWVVSGTVTATIAAPTDWGTAPATSVLVPAVNAEMFVGQNAVSGTNPVPISATTAANGAGNPIYVDVTNFPTTFAVTQGTSPWVVSLTSTTITGTVAVDGALSNNTAAPAATNLGVLPAIAETAYNTITYTTGNQVLPVTDLHGALNIDLQALAGTALGAGTTWGTAPTGANVQGVNAYCIQGTSPWVVSLASTTITGTVAVTQSTSPWITAGNLTNNNAAPTATLTGTLNAIAESAYTNLTYTSGDMVLPATDLHGALMSDLEAIAGVALGATGVTAFGTAPAAVNVQGVNASLFSGTTALTNTGGALNVNVTGFSGGTLSNNTAAPIANNEGSLTALAATSYTTNTYTNGFQVLPVTDLHGALNQDLQAVAGIQLGATAVTAYGTTPAAVNVPAVNAFVTNTITVAGNRSNNTAVPGALNIGALVSITAPSNTTFPTYVAGNESLLVTDLSGNLNTDVQYWGGSDLGPASNYGTSPGAVLVPGVNAFVTNPVSVYGYYTNNNAAPNTQLLPVIGAIAETSYTTITYTTGDMVLPVVDLHGATNTDLQAVAGTAVVTVAAGVQEVGIVGSTGAAMDTPIGASTAAANALQIAAVTLTTAPTLTNGQSGAVQADTTGSIFINNDGRKATYSCYASFTPVAGDIAVLPGSASKTIRIHRIEVSLSTTGTAGVEAVTLVKRSAADTGGTSAAMTAVPHDSAFAAASAAPRNYTAAPTLGAAVGTVRGAQFFDESASTTGANTWLWTFGDGRGGAAAIVLRGIAQQLAINLSGVIATQTVSVSYEWTEE